MAYGYVRDKEPLSINWAEISKNFNDRLAADEAERQGKREDIQKQYDELSQQLIDKPTGADTDLNSAISSFTTQASQASLDALNRLKRGEISEQEYYNRRANLKSSTSNLFLYANNFNSQLEENLKLIQSQDPDNQGSGRMAFQMALAQDMLNFKNTVAIIDPATDEVMLVKTDEEGNPTNEVVSVSQLGNLSSQKENSYNYKGRIARALENRGVAKYTTEDGKVITTIQGVDIKPGTATATIDKLAESFVGDESQILSILYQNGYQYTQDESLKGKDKYIYYDIKNGTYDYDKDKAVEFVKEDINNSIPVEVKDEISAYQQEQLDRADRAFDEGVRQFDETLKLKQDELLAETNTTASNVSSPTNFFRSTSGSDITANNYIRSINEDSLSTEQKQTDVAINLNEVLNTVGVTDAAITINKGGEKITYEDRMKEPISFEQYRKYGGGVKTKPSIVINIPGVTEGDIVVPVDYKISNYLEKIMNAIGNAKKTNTTIKGSDFEFIINNDFYNPGARQEEEVVVEDEEVVVDPTKYNN